MIFDIEERKTGLFSRESTLKMRTGAPEKELWAAIKLETDNCIENFMEESK